jgi:hypothetical protein
MDFARACAAGLSQAHGGGGAASRPPQARQGDSWCSVALTGLHLPVLTPSALPASRCPLPASSEYRCARAGIQLLALFRLVERCDGAEGI